MILLVKSTESSPRVVFMPTLNTVQITGVSMMENPIQFYDLLLDWVDKNNYNKGVGFEFQLDYFNTASSKLLLDLFNRIKSIDSSNKIAWYCEKDDEDMIEVGEDFSELIGEMFEVNMFTR